jgi:hypothetical protein
MGLPTSSGASRRARIQKPSKRRAVLSNFLDGINDAVVLEWKRREYERIFENASDSELSEFIKKIQESMGGLEAILKTLESIQESKRKIPTSIDGVNYRDENRNWQWGKRVSVTRYIQLYTSGNLDFLVEDKNPPEHLPNLEQAKRMVAEANSD